MDKTIIKIWADYDSTGIMDEDGRRIKKGELNIPNHLWKELQIWTSDYQEVILWNSIERKKTKSKIFSLDNRGLHLTTTIQEILGDKYFVKYYSEGLMEYLFK